MHNNLKFFYSRKAVLILLTTAFFFSCNSGNGESKVSSVSAEASIATFDTLLGKGSVNDTVLCTKDNRQTYAIYLPTGYTTSKAFPCIYFFDAHARGSLPVRRYKDIAEKYGFVLVGSNNSQNGMALAETNGVAKTMMEDVQARVNIDRKRIYTSGFSGGSRVAASIALAGGGIAGVIGCAGGFPQEEGTPQGKFDYFGIAGTYDFNFSEMAQLDQMLEQSGFVHQLLTSSGSHGWAAAKDLETGVLWLQANAIDRKSVV